MSFGWRLVVLVVATFVVNLPFGYWRGGLRKRSAAWFVAIHAPVPLVIVARMNLDLELSWTVILPEVVAYGLGQWLGARLRT